MHTAILPNVNTCDVQKLVKMRKCIININISGVWSQSDTL